ncbi:MAG: redox-sensing transcriptional repressor Rex [Gemmatimonadetes bacterium]|nr:redox-sensing transcriptional repressor Rex [Gemmatimonadota bacterium]
MGPDGRNAVTDKRIPDSTVRRLSLYLRFLGEFEASGLETVSSEALAERGGTTAAQVRKDLSHFGSFGKRGLGYSVEVLARELRRILGLEREWRVALIGAGRIGTALFEYEPFRNRGFHITTVLDNDPEKVGRRLGDVTIQPMEELHRGLDEGGIDLVILAVPATVAQSVLDDVVQAGVGAVLNYAPTQLRAPDHVALRSVSMLLELEALSYALSRQGPA